MEEIHTTAVRVAKLITHNLIPGYEAKSDIGPFPIEMRHIVIPERKYRTSPCLYAIQVDNDCQIITGYHRSLASDQMRNVEVFFFEATPTIIDLIKMAMIPCDREAAELCELYRHQFQTGEFAVLERLRAFSKLISINREDLNSKLERFLNCEELFPWRWV